MKSIREKREVFRRLHETGCFALPNPWDPGTAKYLQHLGFKAIATTSAGFAFSRGLADGSVKRDEMIGHIRSRYMLAYHEPPSAPGAFRHLGVTLTETARRRFPLAELKARNGYYAE